MEENSSEMRSSKPEKILQTALRKNKIKFKTHHKLNNHKVDIFIKPDICIEVDGKIFHNFPYGTDKDRRETTWMEMHGFTVLRFWDSEVLEDAQKLVEVFIQPCIKKDFGGSLFNFEPMVFTPFKF